MTMIRIYVEVDKDDAQAVLETLKEWNSDEEMPITEVLEVPAFNGEWGHCRKNPVIMFETHISHVQEYFNRLQGFAEKPLSLLVAV